MDIKKGLAVITFLSGAALSTFMLMNVGSLVVDKRNGDEAHNEIVRDGINFIEKMRQEVPHVAFRNILSLAPIHVEMNVKQPTDLSFAIEWEQDKDCNVLAEAYASGDIVAVRLKSIECGGNAQFVEGFIRHENGEALRGRIQLVETPNGRESEVVLPAGMRLGAWIYGNA